MKRIILSTFFVFFISGNVFAQSKPEETFRKFWKSARSNKVKSASKFFANIQAQDQEKNNRQIIDSLKTISQNKLKFPELDNSQIFTGTAYFRFQIETKDRKKFSGQVVLLNRNMEWKILFFNVNPIFEVRISPSTNASPPPVRFVPGTPVTKKCSICS